MRFSSRREAVLGVMRSVHCHPDAEWVHRKVREKIPGISLGTVYRNLRELSEAGLLITLETEAGSLHFDADVSPHAHFVCRECGCIGDLHGYGDCRERLEREGYVVDSVKTVVYGTCVHCAQKRRS